MSIGKRLIDLARANLNALLDKASGETSIDELTDDELEAELLRRRERRQREEDERKAAQRAADQARARASNPSPRVEPPRASAPPPRTSAPPPGTSAPPRTSVPPPRSDGRRDGRREQRKGAAASGSMSDKRLRELYAQLEVPYGAPFDEVKSSFRRLMRKYHPDLHAGNPQKHQTATQLTMSLTQAYNELELHLVGGPNRG